MKKGLLFIACIFVVAVLITGKTYGQKNGKVITCSDFHVTLPLRDLVKIYPVDDKKDYGEIESEDRENRPPQKFKYSADDGPMFGEDTAVRQTKMGTRNSSMKAPLTNWIGQTATGFRPFDPTGAAGPNHYIQMINSTTFKVYNKTGTVLLTATLGTLWSPATPNSGDPIVMYDKYADRWFLSQFGTTGNKVYIAISTSSDPTGSYYTYTFTSAQFPDYLKFSIWENGYYMTSNQTTDKVFCFERDQMLIGNSASRAISANFTTGSVSAFYCPLPGDAADGGLPDPGTPMPFFSYYDNGWGGGTDGVKIWNMTVTWGVTPSASITGPTQVNTSAFDATYDASWNDVTQPGTTQKLDGIGGVPMFRAQWRPWSGYNSVVMNWGVLISSTTGQRSIRWVELRQDQSTSTWSLYQEGTYTPDADTRWMGSIAMDNNGSIALAYCKSSSTTYPSLCYTGRLASDPLGTMSFAETVAVAGTGSQTTTNRYGDYAHTSLDPNGITFWHTGEYITSTVQTRIFSFQLPLPNPVASVNIAVTSGSNPTCTGFSLTFTATPVNGGTTPTYQWKKNGSDIAGATNSTYSSSTLVTGNLITCVMTSNLPGVTGSPATSNTITMTVNSIPATPTAASNTPVCGGSTINLTTPSVTGATYSWAGPNSFSSTTQNPSIASSTTAMAGTYSVSVTVSGCTSQAGSTTVVVNSAPATPTASSNSPVCLGSTINLSTPTVTGATYSWTGPYSFISALQNPTIASAIAANAGTYYVSILLGGCSSLAGTTSVVLNSPPVATFTGSPISTVCSGFVQFTDNSSGSPSSWLWDFGDGQTSTLQNPSHTYAASGTYTVVLNSTNTCGVNQFTRTNYITISTASLPTVNNASRCGTGSVTLTATGSGTPEWFTASTGGALVNTGTSYNTPSLTTTTTYYVQDSIPGATHNCAKSDNSGGGGYTSSGDHYLIFDCSTPVKLVSVKMYGNPASVPGSRTIELRNSAGTVLQSATVNIAANLNTIVLNFNLPAATGLRLACTSGVDIYRNNAGVTFPYTTTGFISVTGASTSGYYYYFYDWIIQEAACKSSRNAVTATIIPTVNADLSISANPSGAICAGSSITLTATPINGGATPSYQWKKNGTNLSSATNSTYNTNTLANADIITCVMTSNATCVTGSPVTSNSLTMIINSAPALPGVIAGVVTQAPALTGQIYSINPVADATSYTWTVPVGWQITAGQGTTAITVTSGSVGQNGDIVVSATNDCGTSSPQTLAVNVQLPYKTLTLTSLMFEGLYSSNETMRQARDNIGPHWPAGVADHITIELHDEANYSVIIYSAANIPLSITGTAIVNVPLIYNGSYYITIRHRNSIETTTATAVSFAGNLIDQSFGTPADVYSGNLGVSSDSHYFIYAGDVNQDGSIDTGDYIEIDNDSYNYLTGYINSDVNGDGIIDTDDYIPVDNNNYHYIVTVHP